MKCPHCGVWTRVLETRARKAHTTRRYECANLHRFSTRETVSVRPDSRRLAQIDVDEPPVALLLDADASEPGIER
jgi:hypothetical protein